jgi:2-keto-4-pentenoate hydratase/2-oxohepta-3-ene-1,7-dioic acid hydratase in catechol pathway
MAIPRPEATQPPRLLLCVDDNYRCQPRPRRAGLALTRPAVLDGLLPGGPFDDVFITAADPRSLVWEGTPVVIPQGCDRLDVGVSLVARIGSSAECPSVAYSVGLDFVRRDVPAVQPYQARSFPTHKLMSAVAVPAAGFTFDPLAELVLRVDGETRQRSTLAQMIARPAELVALIAERCELRDGDVVFTGTPNGTALDAGHGWLRAGSVVDAEVSGLGTVTATVRAEDA